MEIFIGGILFLGLCAWILIDAHLLRKKPVKVTPKIPGAPYNASEIKQARYLLIGLSCVFYTMAVAEWLNPSLPPFTGRGSWLYGMLYYGIGSKGASVFWALLGTALFLIALFKKPIARR
jgi:hypothetical protein